MQPVDSCVIIVWQPLPNRRIGQQLLFFAHVARDDRVGIYVVLDRAHPVVIGDLQK